MKAVYITEHGGVDVLTLGELPEPPIGSHDVKIKVRACALNRLDIYTRAGIRGTRLSLNEPHILGGDVAGDVVEIGDEVTRVKPGDRVVVTPRLTCTHCQFCLIDQEELCINPGMLGSTVNGGYAEYISIPAINVVSLPNSISYEEGASLPTVFLPCWSIFIRKGILKPQETALILSASSGVGTAAIQVAKKVVGARVIATTSTNEKALKATNLGADAVINYTQEDIVERVSDLTDGRGVDIVLDHVGAEFWPAAMASLAPGGRYGICGITTGHRAELQLGSIFLKHQTIFGVFMGRVEDLKQIVKFASDRVIQGTIHQTFHLNEASKAHEVLETRNFFGKLVLTVP